MVQNRIEKSVMLYIVVQCLRICHNTVIDLENNSLHKMYYNVRVNGQYQRTCSSIEQRRTIEQHFTLSPIYCKTVNTICGIRKTIWLLLRPPLSLNVPMGPSKLLFRPRPFFKKKRCLTSGPETPGLE